MAKKKKKKLKEVDFRLFFVVVRRSELGYSDYLIKRKQQLCPESCRQVQLQESKTKKRILFGLERRNTPQELWHVDSEKLISYWASTFGREAREMKKLNVTAKVTFACSSHFSSHGFIVLRWFLRLVGGGVGGKPKRSAEGAGKSFASK